MAKYKVLVTARSFGTTDDKAVKLLTENDCEVEKISAADRSLLLSKLAEADAVIAGLEDYDAETFANVPKLKVVSRYGVGYDKVDVAAAKAKGIKVTITPGANSDAVADLAVALTLACARSIPVMDKGIKGRSQVRPQGIELWNKTLGIIGAGRIGKGVAMRLRGFNMRVLLFDQYQDAAFALKYGAEYTDFETILKEADFISIHSPLTDETRNMFGAEQFRMMKKDAVIVNTARGGIIDETALYEALKNGEIRAAGLDATVDEPPYDSPLCTLDNCILTPHAGAATKEASSNMSLMAAQNALDVLTSGECRFEV